MSGSFDPRGPQDILALVQAHPLAWLVPRDGDAAATPLPLLAECDGEGRITALFGHMARRNPLFAALQAQPRTLVLFQGPQAYVPPRLVAKPDWGPTWNYAVARFDTRVEFVPDETDASLRRLAAHLEQGRAEPWTVERMGPRYAQLREHVIAFRAHVRDVHATFKLGQDETRTSFDEIVAGTRMQRCVNGCCGFGRIERWPRRQIAEAAGRRIAKRCGIPHLSAQRPERDFGWTPGPVGGKSLFPRSGLLP